jgi:hypothetical protein
MMREGAMLERWYQVIQHTKRPLHQTKRQKTTKDRVGTVLASEVHQYWRHMGQYWRHRVRSNRGAQQPQTADRRAAPPAMLRMLAAAPGPSLSAVALYCKKGNKEPGGGGGGGGGCRRLAADQVQGGLCAFHREATRRHNADWLASLSEQRDRHRIYNATYGVTNVPPFLDLAVSGGERGGAGWSGGERGLGR